MVTTPYPLPRSARRTDVMLGNGGTDYGPFGAGWGIFDVNDVRVWTKPAGASLYVETAATVTKTAGNPYDTFSISVAGGIANTTQFYVEGERVHERSVGVSRGGALSAQALELELSKIAAVLQEMRRDLNDYANAGERLVLVEDRISKRVLKIADNDAVADLPDLPSAALRAGQLLGFTSPGGQLTIYPITPTGVFTGILGVDKGGTGGGDPATARANLGLTLGTSGSVIGKLDTDNTWKGTQTFGDNTGAANVNVVAPSGATKLLRYLTGLLARWTVGGTATAESGSDVGSDFAIQRFSDAGALLGTPLLINRKTGAWTISGVVTFSNSIVDPAIGDGTAAASIFLNGAAGTARSLWLQSGGVNRFRMFLNTSAESGSDAGSTLSWQGYSDAGVSLGTYMSINRANGLVTVTNTLKHGGHAPGITTLSPTTGSTVAPAAKTVRTVVINNAATIAALTFTLPTTDAQDGHAIKLVTRSAITTLTVNGEGGATVYNAPTTLAAGASVEFTYVAGVAWFKG